MPTNPDDRAMKAYITSTKISEALSDQLAGETKDIPQPKNSASAHHVAKNNAHAGGPPQEGPVPHQVHPGGWSLTPLLTTTREEKTFLTWRKQTAYVRMCR